MAVPAASAAKVAGHDGGFFVEPTVFPNVTSGMRIFQEEVFGPFTSVTSFKDEADALRLANDSPFGLAAAITNDVSRAHRVAAKVKCGIVWSQRISPFDPASTTSGRRRRQRHRREGDTESFDDHFNVKSVMIATGDATQGPPFDWYRETATQRRLN